MSDRIFEMRLTCRYKDPDNTIDTLDAEIMHKNTWQRLKISTLSPGFLLYNYALFSCQHLYFRTNSAESGLMLESSKGYIKTIADEHWAIHHLEVKFEGLLKSGQVEQKHIDYIIDRMGHCPVSTNSKLIADRSTVVTFDSASQ